MMLAWHFAMLIFICLLWEVASVSAKIVVVPHDHPSVTYAPHVCAIDCTRDDFQQWWKTYLANGVWSYRTKGNTTSATLTFKGSSVTWYGLSTLYGAKALVYLDGIYAQVVDTYSPQYEGVVGWTYTKLDPSQKHTLSISYDYQALRDELPEHWLDIRHFEYDDGTDDVVTTSPPPTSTGIIATDSTMDTRTDLRCIQTMTMTATATTTETETVTAGSNSIETSLIFFGSSTDTESVPFVLATGENQPSASSTERANNITEAESNGDSSQASFKSTTAVILGTALGSGALVLAALLFLLHRRRKREQLQAMYEPEPLQLLGYGNGSSPLNAKISGRAPTSCPPPRYLPNASMENHLSNPTSVAASRLNRKASETGMDSTVFAPLYPNSQHLSHFGALHYLTTKAPTGSRHQRGQSMAASVWSRTHMAEVVEMALTCHVISDARPPVTPPPQYALCSLEAYHPPKNGDLRVV